VAKEERVSDSLVKRCFTEATALQLGIDGMKPKARRVIGLGEFSTKKRMFDTTVSDLEQRKVLGIVKGCGKTNLEKYFTALPNPEIVEVVVMICMSPSDKPSRCAYPKLRM
jgi:hypothetical protein